MVQSGCPSQTSSVPKLLHAHSDGVVDSSVNVSYGPYVNIRYYPANNGSGWIVKIPIWYIASYGSRCNARRRIVNSPMLSPLRTSSFQTPLGDSPQQWVVIKDHALKPSVERSKPRRDNRLDRVPDGDVRYIVTCSTVSNNNMVSMRLN